MSRRGVLKCPSIHRSISMSFFSKTCARYHTSQALHHGISRPCYSIRNFRASNVIRLQDDKHSAITSDRIHILGVGNIGRLFAHALAKEKNPPPITLLLHRKSLLEEWGEAGQEIQITTDGIPDRSSGYDTELIPSPGQIPQEADIIKNLIVPTKTIHTLPALTSIKSRLSSESTILFAQNGMGTIEQVTQRLFPDPCSRPHYLACITHHGVYSEGPFQSVHAGRANMTIGTVRGRGDNQEAPRYLLEKILQASLLSATEAAPDELFRLRVVKLVINAMINPLTVIFNRRNGELFNQGPILKVMRALLVEASQVIQSLPELRDDPDATASRFSPQNLELRVLEAADKTAKNTSSMLQDVRAGRETEIDYINGWVLKSGAELGVDCEVNEMVVKMVKGNTIIAADDAEKYFPNVTDRNW